MRAPPCGPITELAPSPPSGLWLGWAENAGVTASGRSGERSATGEQPAELSPASPWWMKRFERFGPSCGWESFPSFPFLRTHTVEVPMCAFAYPLAGIECCHSLEKMLEGVGATGEEETCGSKEVRPAWRWERLGCPEAPTWWMIVTLHGLALVDMMISISSTRLPLICGKPCFQHLSCIR